MHSLPQAQRACEDLAVQLSAHVNWRTIFVRSHLSQPIEVLERKPQRIYDLVTSRAGRICAMKREALARVGLTGGAMTPAEFDAFIRSEMQKNGRIVRSLKLKVE